MRAKYCPFMSIGRNEFTPCIGPVCALWTYGGPVPAVAPDGSPAGSCCLLELVGGEFPASKVMRAPAHAVDPREDTAHD